MLKKILLLCVMLSLFSPFSWAQSPEFALENPELAYVYQQNSYLKEDLIGDILLAHSMMSAAQGVFYILAGKKEEFYSKPYVRAYELAKIFPKISRINGRDAIYVNPLPAPENYYLLDERRIFSEIDQLFLNNSIRKGSIPNWSKDFNKNFRSKIMPGVPFSKLLSCLIRGVCARFMFTGLESKIESRIMKLPDLSLNPVSLLKICLSEANQDMTLALLACQNTLSWHSKAEDRYKTQLQTKLRPFILSDGSKSYDKFGEWYHLFGLMTYSFVKGDSRAWYIGQVENIGASWLTGDEEVEEFVNSFAPEIGGKLSEYFK